MIITQLANSNNYYEEWRDNWINYAMTQFDGHTCTAVLLNTVHRLAANLQTVTSPQWGKKFWTECKSITSLSTLFSSADIFLETWLLWWRKQYTDLYSGSSPFYQYTDILSSTALWHLTGTRIALYGWGGGEEELI